MTLVVQAGLGGGGAIIFITCCANQNPANFFPAIYTILCFIINIHAFFLQVRTHLAVSYCIHVIKSEMVII